MGLFKSKAERELDYIIQRLEMNMANNYKDNAQDNLRELEETFERLKTENAMKEKVASRYETIIFGYKSKLKGYSHKDQKPFWT